MLGAPERKDATALRSLPRERLHSVASEAMNWVTLGGALHETDLKMELLDYVPVYRTPAGTGGGWVRALALRASRPRRGRRLVMPTMTIERVRAFNGLDVLVARDEGLFEAEGVDLRIAALPPSVPGGPNRCMPRELFGQFPTVAGEPGSTTRACS